MVHDSFLDQVRQILAARRDRIFKLASKDDAVAYVDDVRKKIAECFGPWPERTPLNPKITGVVERDAYRIENVIFESRPQFFVTANLYVPKGLTNKAPGVIGSCGHSTNGKAHEAYQSFAQGLARLGYVSLIFDPIGQGERLQLPDANGKPRIGVGVGEHMMVGNQQFLVGEFFGAWRAWDGMRALDYLVSREEVDPKQLGITGNSGGGTMTTWLCGVEPRWTMAAPSCFVTSFLNNLENELPADTEQCPPGAIAAGLDHGDFIACIAPHPVVLLTQEKDYFDVRGSVDTLGQLRHIYKLLGAEENVMLFTGPGGHGYAQDAREAMYACFHRATGLGESKPSEPKLTIEDDKTLQCTKNGQVVELKSRPVYSFTKEIAEGLAKKRGEFDFDELYTAIICGPDVNVVEPGPDERRKRSSRYRILRSRPTPGLPLAHLTTYLLDVESGIAIPIYRLYSEPHYSRPPKVEGPAILYVAHDSSLQELASEPLVRDALKEQPGAALYAVDVSGLGESRPNTCGENSYATSYGCDYFYAAHAIMLNESYVGRRMADVTAALDFVTYQGGHADIHLIAKGFGAIPAALASLPAGAPSRVTLKNSLTSYADLAAADLYQWPLSSLTPGILQLCDLPDVYRSLTNRKHLTLVDPLGPDVRPK
jgi:dienelactone hydrolase